MKNIIQLIRIVFDLCFENPYAGLGAWNFIKRELSKNSGEFKLNFPI